MKDEDKTKDQLINELILLRQRITELERLENGRKQAEEWESKYRHLFENLNNAAFLADAETGHIIETNNQGEVLLGRTREEIISMHQASFTLRERLRSIARGSQPMLRRGALRIMKVRLSERMAALSW